MAGSSGFTVPGAKPITEWASPIKGVIDTCVSAAEAVMTGIYRVPGLATSPSTTTRLAEDQIARGEATSHGASYVGSAGAQLARLGIPNTDIEGQSRIAGTKWTQLVNGALVSGRPVLGGVTNDGALVDRVTGQRNGRAPIGHGFTIVGVDAAGKGYLVADPNTPGTAFADYSPATLQAAGLSSLIVPNAAPAAVQGSAQSASASPGSPGNAGAPIGLGPVASTVQGTATTGTPAWLSGVEGFASDAGKRIALWSLAGILIVVGLIVFFREPIKAAAVEGAKTGAKVALAS